MTSTIFHSRDPRNGTETEKAMPNLADPLSLCYFQFSLKGKCIHTFTHTHARTHAHPHTHTAPSVINPQKHKHRRHEHHFTQHPQGVYMQVQVHIISGSPDRVIGTVLRASYTSWPMLRVILGGAYCFLILTSQMQNLKLG